MLKLLGGEASGTAYFYYSKRTLWWGPDIEIYEP
jgi:hypothetical protein